MQPENVSVAISRTNSTLAWSMFLTATDMQPKTYGKHDSGFDYRSDMTAQHVSGGNPEVEIMTVDGITFELSPIRAAFPHWYHYDIVRTVASFIQRHQRIYHDYSFSSIYFRSIDLLVLLQRICTLLSQFGSGVYVTYLMHQYYLILIRRTCPVVLLQIWAKNIAMRKTNHHYDINVVSRKTEYTSIT